MNNTSPTFVPPFGDPKTAKYIIIGEQPGRMEVVRARPFASSVGHELDSILQDVKIRKSDCYFRIFINYIICLSNIFGDII